MATKDMDKSPAMLLYTDKFFSGTADMQPETVGIYIRLLTKLWTLPDGLENDTKRLAKLSLVSEKVFIKSWCGDFLSEKFILNEKGKLTNVKLEKERLKRLGKSEAASESARIRWELEKKKNDANALETHSENGINAKHININKENINKESIKEKKSLPKNEKKPKAFISYDSYVELLKKAEIPNSCKNGLAQHFKMREAKKWNCTEYAATLLIKTTTQLYKTYGEGSAVECINASIKGLWKDIFPPKHDNKPQVLTTPLSRAERADRNATV